MSEWREVFWITFAVIIVTNFAYVFMGSGELQPWNDLSQTTEAEAINQSSYSRSFFLVTASFELTKFFRTFRK